MSYCVGYLCFFLEADEGNYSIPSGQALLSMHSTVLVKYLNANLVKIGIFTVSMNLHLSAKQSISSSEKLLLKEKLFEAGLGSVLAVLQAHGCCKWTEIDGCAMNF